MTSEILPMVWQPLKKLENQSTLSFLKHSQMFLSPVNREKLGPEICSKMIYLEIRCKDLKPQELQGYFLNSRGTISNVTSNLLGLKNNKTLPPDEIMKQWSIAILMQ